MIAYRGRVEGEEDEEEEEEVSKEAVAAGVGDRWEAAGCRDDDEFRSSDERRALRVRKEGELFARAYNDEGEGEGERKGAGKGEPLAMLLKLRAAIIV